MRYILLIIVFLFTSFGYGKEYTSQTSTPTLVYQPMMENSKPSTNHSSSIKSQEGSYIDTADDELRALPKSKPKRHLFAKTVLGLAGTFIATVIIFIVVTGGWEFKY
jgi:hypothetical protein